MSLTHYRTLGRSGLAVSPLALGTMTFGAGRWGADAAQSQAIFDAGAPPMLNPYFIFDLPRERIFGGQHVEKWRAVR